MREPPLSVSGHLTLFAANFYGGRNDIQRMGWRGGDSPLLDFDHRRRLRWVVEEALVRV